MRNVKPINDNIISKVSTFLNMLASIGEDINDAKYSRGNLLMLEDFNSSSEFTDGETLHWMSLIYTCIRYDGMGDLVSAKEDILEALSLNIAVINPFVRGASLIVYCRVLRLCGELDFCTPEINEISDLGYKYHLPYFIAFSRNLKAVSIYLGLDTKAATEAMVLSTHYYLDALNKPRAALNSMYVCLWLAPQKSYNHLAKRAQDSFNIIKSFNDSASEGDSLSSYSIWPDIIEISQSILGAVQSESGLYKEAEINLLESLKISESNKSKQISCGTSFHLSKLYYKIGNTEQGENYLRHAFFSASNNEYYTFYVMHFKTFLEISIRAFNMNICTEYILIMIEKYFGLAAKEYYRSTAILVTNDGISDFVLSFIEKYDQKDNSSDVESIHISVKLFGQFSITVNGIPIDDNDWKTKKEKLILKYLFLNIDQSVSRETLIDIFWEKYDRKSAGASLRVALSELRKLMQKYNISLDNNFPLIREVNSNLVIKRSYRIKSDFDDFNALYLSYKNHMKIYFPEFIKGNNDNKKAGLNGEIAMGKLSPKKRIIKEKLKDEMESITRILENIISLYTNDLLCDDLYEDFLEPIRVKYKTYFLDASEVLSLIYIRDNRLIEAEELILRIIDLDYLNEDACLNLIQLYVSSGRSSMALNLYTTFRNRFVKEMEFEPSPILKQALRKTE